MTLTTWNVRLDTVNVSMVDVHPGHERSFHDWYEADHFYAGGVLAPPIARAELDLLYTLDPQGMHW